MNNREMSLLWIKDILEHLASCRKQIEWSDDPRTCCVLTEAMLRDLERCKRLCEALHERSNERLQGVA